METDRPTWQVADCPEWCVREHEEEDRDGDRDHESEGITVPVIRRVRQVEGVQVTRELVADEVFVVATQAQEKQRPIISIGVQDSFQAGLELRDESADRLARALGSVLEEVRS